MRKSILVVDDDQTVRTLLQELLEDEAYEVETAIDGVDALDHLDHQQSGYDVILLDLTMPRLNGLQFLRHVQEHDPASCARSSRSVQMKKRSSNLLGWVLAIH